MSDITKDKTETKKETPFETTQRLTHDAVLAVEALSNHLEKVPDKPRMYKANTALHILWNLV